eukprot:GCRY01005999.1.p1 GENE.GCRY01005999.1~~GCRY01005999.1.p1  ORF type:complete len:125 (+),score=5.66 GCRY01005999.1:314-688(+)
MIVTFPFPLFLFWFIFLTVLFSAALARLLLDSDYSPPPLRSYCCSFPGVLPQFFIVKNNAAACVLNTRCCILLLIRKTDQIILGFKPGTPCISSLFLPFFFVCLLFFVYFPYNYVCPFPMVNII